MEAGAGRSADVIVKILHISSFKTKVRPLF